MNKSKYKKEIGVRTFSGSSVPVGSILGKIIINSEDSDIVAKAIRGVVHGNKDGKISISPSTVAAIRKAKERL